MSPLLILPTLYEDPFLSLRPFPANDTGNHFIDHWHEIAVMVVFYTIIQGISPWINSKLFGVHYTSLNKKNKINFDIHTVSMVQCVISLVTLALMWNNKYYLNRVEDPYGSVTGYFPYAGLVASCATGYFIWDVYVCLKYYLMFGFGFLFHGVAALYVFGGTLIPFCMPWISSFLAFEALTPFVNINWYASRLPAGVISEKVVVVNGLLLIFSFFSVRILWGFYAVSLVATDLYRTWGATNPILPVMLLSINVCLDCLNVFWFYKMIMIAKKKITGAKPKTLAKEAADKID